MMSAREMAAEAAALEASATLENELLACGLCGETISDAAILTSCGHHFCRCV